MQYAGYEQPYQVVAATLAQEQPPFLKAMERSLELRYAEVQALRTVDPRIWIDWTIGALANDELRPGLPLDERVNKVIPAAARSLVGAEVEFEGQPVLAYDQGVLAKKVQALHDRGGQTAHRKLDVVSKAAAKFFNVMRALVGPNSRHWTEAVPRVPQTHLVSNKDTGDLEVRFAASDQRFVVEGGAETVVNYGPGITGDTFVGAMIGQVSEVHLVSGGKGAGFINAWIGNSLAQMQDGIDGARASGTLHMQPMLPKGVPLDRINVAEVYYYRDGIAQAAGAIAAHAEENVQPVDIVVMSAVHSAGPAEVLAGIDGASVTLREGGLLVVKGPDISLPGEAGMDIAGRRAAQLLGRPVLAGECGTQSQYIDSSQPVARPASFAIYQK
jgi:hypothetical protein